MAHRWLTPIAIAVLAATVVAGTAAAATPAAIAQQDANETAAENATVDVGVGQQLSAVVATTSADLRADYEERAFKYEYESADDEARDDVLAERASTVESRARSIRRAYRNATAAYEAGEIDRGEYARRVATLNARAERVLEDAEAVRERADGETDFEAAGVDRTAFERAVGDVESLTGPGQRALLRQFTGVSEGEIEVRTGEAGVRLEVESDDGERSREVRRSRDDSTEMTVAEADARAAARGVLSTGVGNWTLEEGSAHEDSGYWKFEYRLDAASATGEAEVRVDGSTGEVFRIEEEIEAPEREDDREGDDEREEDDERDDEDEREEETELEEEHEREDETEREAASDGDLDLAVVDGTAAPGESVTVRAARDGEPAANVSVELNGEAVGSTDADGRLSVTLPAEEAELRAEHGDAEAELEFEFEADDETTDDERESDADAEDDDPSETEDEETDG